MSTRLGENMSDMLATMLEVLTDRRNDAHERGDSEAVSEIARYMNIIGGAATELGALSVQEHNAIVERETNELPPDRGIAADLITARLTILRAVDGHDDADLPAAAAMLQRAIDSLDTNTMEMEMSKEMTVRVSSLIAENEEAVLRKLIAWEMVGRSVNELDSLSREWAEIGENAGNESERRFAQAMVTATAALAGEHMAGDASDDASLSITNRTELERILDAAEYGVKVATLSEEDLLATLEDDE